uniref:Uncharacterized protein n=1 Tax=Romanomermis culicivorax TaxID=13658 RepID=A0A915JRF2_ROMCU
MDKIFIIAFLAICVAAIWAVDQRPASSEENKNLQQKGGGRHHAGHHRRHSTTSSPFNRAKRDFNQGEDGLTPEGEVPKSYHGRRNAQNRNHTGGRGQWHHNKTGRHDWGRRRWHTTPIPL